MWGNSSFSTFTRKYYAIVIFFFLVGETVPELDLRGCGIFHSDPFHLDSLLTIFKTLRRSHNWIWSSVSVSYSPWRPTAFPCKCYFQLPISLLSTERLRLRQQYHVPLEHPALIPRAQLFITSFGLMVQALRGEGLHCCVQCFRIF